MADNKISSSKREIYTKILDIAEKYTDIKDTDFLKTGLFGYMTETMAMMMRDSTFHKSMLYNESFLNTATIPRSVYNWAKMFNIEVQKASPKYATINIIIPTQSIQTNVKTYNSSEAAKFGLTESISDVIILNKADPILAGDYYFSLEHSILIKKDYSAEYLLDEAVTTNFETIVTPKLATKIDGQNLVITATAYQYRTITSISSITTNSFLNKIQKITFEDQFCGASLYYEEYNGKYTEIPLYYSDMKPPVGKRCAFYNLNDANELELIFKHGDSYFMPSANTKLKTYVYVTKGEGAPLVYSGDALMMISDNDLKSLPLLIQFNPTALMGGKNQPDITTIKQTIIREISTRNVITTQSDLDNFFDILISLIEDVNDGKIKFIKKRDDIVKRVFNAYLLLRDNIDDSKSVEVTNTRALSSVIPTNTIDVQFSTSLTDAATELAYSKFDFEGNLINNVTDDCYICPFLISVTKSPFRFVKYVYNMTDSETDAYINEKSDGNSLTIDEEGKISLYVIPEKVRLFRGFGEESFKPTDYYKLYITTTTNGAIGNDISGSGIFSEVTNDNNSSSITIRELKGNTPIASYVVPYNDILVYSEPLDTGVFKTTFEITINVRKADDDKTRGEFYYDASLSYLNNHYNKISLNSATNGSTSTTEVNFNASTTLQIDLSHLEVEGQNLGLILDTTRPVKFFEVLDNYMDSAIEFNAAGEIIGLRDIPVIHSSYFNRSTEDANTKRKDNFIKQLFTYIEILKKNIERLETSTSFNIKFYNTYGPSELYAVDTTNLKLGFIVHLAKEEYLNDDTLKAEIRSYIRKVVDKMNENKAINITSLQSSITSPSAYGKYIEWLEFVGLNGNFNQYIYRLEDKDENLYTPEWLNIDYNSLNDLDQNYDSIQFTFK